MSPSVFALRLAKYQQFRFQDFKSIKKGQGFTLKLNLSLHVTEHFCSTSSDILTFSISIFQKYQNTSRIYTKLEFVPPCHGTFLPYATWNINIFDFNIPASASIRHPSRIQITLKMIQIGIRCSRTKVLPEVRNRSLLHWKYFSIQTSEILS